MNPLLKDIVLEKDKEYDIKLEYFEDSLAAGLELVWLMPGQSKDSDEYKQSMMLSNKTITEVKNADVAIFVGGLDATWEGEEMKKRQGIDGFNVGDRTKIELPEVQMNALKTMIKTGTPVILVLMSGSAISFDGLENELAAIVLAWYPGQRGGEAVADVIFGD